MNTCIPIKSEGQLWEEETELVGISFTLEANTTATLTQNYTTNLHAWFLQQIQQDDPKLSAYLHDGQSEKAFTLSELRGEFLTSKNRKVIKKGEKVTWLVTALNARVCGWLKKWILRFPKSMELNDITLSILEINTELPAKTYAQLWQAPLPKQRNFALTFQSPTSFRHKNHHLPLPIPKNIFHSYLRRWNDFSSIPIHDDKFLTWIETTIFVCNHTIGCVRVAAGKKGIVTGFIGSVEFGVDITAVDHQEFNQLLYALLQLAPYCGTGHKTTFGLGQTRLGSINVDRVESLKETQLFERISVLINIFLQTKKRQGGDRAINSATLWATIIARKEMGESLKDIALDLNMPYETVKRYSKLANHALVSSSLEHQN